MENTKRVMGRYNKAGQFFPLLNPMEVTQDGDALYSVKDGSQVAIKNDDGDWGVPALPHLVIKVEEN